jgi:predicted amidohydrolase
MATTSASAAPLPKVAVAQLTSTADVAANLAACSRLAARAADAGCSLLVLPECCTYLGLNETDALAVAEPLPEGGPTLRHLSQLARQHNLWLSLGGIAESSAEQPQKRYNTHVVLDSSGAVAATYRKAHLFDLELPGKVSLMESRVTLPGTAVTSPVPSPVGKLGLAVCYDLRFAGLFSRLVYGDAEGKDGGAELLLLPAAFTVPTGEAHWELLLRARAAETQTFVLAAAQAGRHNEKRASYGHAMVVDPWGTVIARVPEGPEAEGIAVAEIDLAWLREVRARMPIAQHRLPQLYV